jgi:type II secretory pathway pseudopilin PulG
VLVVIFILGVLAAIVVSVAGYVMSSASRRETEATQKVLLGAVQALYDAGPKAYPQDRYGDPATDPYVAEQSGRALVNFLTGRVDEDNNGTLEQDLSQTAPVKAAVELLLKLPEEAWKGGSNEPIKDGWGRNMRYDAAGGLGGRPVVISAGADGRFGEADPGFPTDDDTKAEDNVRSDESQ